MSLNEGRGSHPGDTLRRRARRVGPLRRSTKAGAPTPATHRHGCGDERVPVRSTKAGAPTPATHATISGSVVTITGRSTKAGAPTPATRAPWARRIRSRNTLNEGRGSHPGDTRVAFEVDATFGPRSTKAGAPTPATLDRAAKGDRDQLRSTKAGAPTPATRYGLRDRWREHGRSTKAGAPTPATRRYRPGPHPDSNPLNEGRGSHPGDTANRAFCSETGSPLGQTALVDHVCAVYLREGRGSHHRICFPGDSQP